MRLVFLCRNQDITIGSYRIWIHDLHKTLVEMGVDAVVMDPSSDIDLEVKNDIIILSKGDLELCHSIKKAFPENKVGVINLGAEHVDLPIDFVIVGSLEEADSVSQYPHVFLYPLIERMFDDIPIKEHKEPSFFEPLKLCYHGHLPHLAKFNPYLSAAIEEFDKEQPVSLKIITGASNVKWEFGKPDIDDITFVKWDINTLAEEIQACDVGIVPNITDYSAQIRSSTNNNLGLYGTDYCFRFKNKSNAGRCFVFHQLGIPVIADLTPSNFHIMGDPKNGHLAMSKNGWLKALRKLASPDYRNNIAISAKTTFDCLYDPVNWAERLVLEMGEMFHE